MKLIHIHIQNLIISKTKTRAPTTAIFGDSIVKNVYDNAINDINKAQQTCFGKAFLKRKN